MEKRKIYIIALIALLLAVFGAANEAITSTGNTSLRIDVNNQNLAPNSPGHPTGLGTRVSGNIYWTNNTAIELQVFAHADTSGQALSVNLTINGTEVQKIALRPLGVAENTYAPLFAIIPIHSNYSIEVKNFHHYEWREYNISSGNTTVTGTTTIDPTLLNLKVNKSGDTMTGVDAKIYSSNGKSYINFVDGFFDAMVLFTNSTLMDYYSSVSTYQGKVTLRSSDMSPVTENVIVVDPYFTNFSRDIKSPGLNVTTSIRANFLNSNQEVCTDVDKYLISCSSGSVNETMLNQKANKSYMIVDLWQIGNDSQLNFTTSQSFVSNSTHIYLNGLKQRLFYDYNETNNLYVNFTSALSENDFLEVEYEKI